MSPVLSPIFRPSELIRSRSWVQKIHSKEACTYLLYVLLDLYFLSTLVFSRRIWLEILVFSRRI